MKLLKKEIPHSTYLGKSIKNNKCLICGSEEIIDDRCLDCGNPSIDIYSIERKTHPKKHILKMSFNLSKTQKAASMFFISHYKDRSSAYLNAVCGSGKTEVMYETILFSLNNNEKPLIACPRKEIIKELSYRLKNVFPNTIIKHLDGQNHDDDGDLILSTIHQLINYEDEFDLIILDEADAFPYSGSDYLKRLVHKALKKTGILFQMSATEKEFIDDDRFTMNRRYHGHNLSMPIFYKMNPKYITSSKEFKDILEGERKVIIYISSINKGLKLSEELDAKFISSKSENCDEIIESFKKNNDKILVSTTILERGITIKNLDCIIFDASDTVFTHQTIIQICGRVGRSYDDPDGSIYIFFEKNSIKFDLVKSYIKRMNAS